MQHTTLALADSSCSEIRINPFLGICDLLRQLLTINPIFLSITLHDICTPYLINCFSIYHKTYETSDPSLLQDLFNPDSASLSKWFIDTEAKQSQTQVQSV